MDVDFRDHVNTVRPEGIVFKVNDEPVLALRMLFPENYNLDEVDFDITGEGEFRAWGVSFSWDHLREATVYTTYVVMEDIIGLPVEGFEEDDDEIFMLTAHDVSSGEIDAMIAFETVPVEIYEYDGSTYRQYEEE